MPLLSACFFYTKKQSKPLLLLAFRIQNLFLLNITHRCLPHCIAALSWPLQLGSAQL